MIPEIGHFALVLVLVLSALGSVGVFQFSQKFGLHELVAPSVVGQFVFATIAFVCLVSSFLFLSMCMRMWMCMCLCLCVCVCRCMCMCMFMCMCMCMRMCM